MQLTKRINNLITPIAVKAWLFLIGITIPISVAAQNIIAFGFGLPLLLYLLYSHKLKVGKWDALFLGAVLALFIIEWAHDNAVSKTGGLLLIFYMFLKIGMWLAAKHESPLSPLLWGLMIGLAIGFGIDIYRRPEYVLWATSGAKYANEAAFIAVTGLFLALSKPWKTMIVIMVPLIVFIFMTGARSSLLAAIIGLSVYIFFHLKSRKSMAIFMIAVGLLGTLTYFPKPDSALYRLHFSVSQTRINLWTNAWKLAEHDGFLGRGEQQFSGNDRDVLHRCCPPTHPGHWKHLVEVPPGSELYRQNISFHNQVIQALVEYGLIGSILMLLFFIIPIYLAFRNKTRFSDATYMIGISLWVAFIVHNVFELGLYNASAILVGLLTGLTDIYTLKSTGADFKIPPFDGKEPA